MILMEAKNGLFEWLLMASIWVFAFFSPVYSSLLFIAVLVLADMATALIALRKNDGNWDNFSSSRWKHTPFKFAAYGIGIMVAFAIEKMWISDIPTIKLVCGLIAFGEFKSLDENIEKITGVSIFKYLIKKLDPNGR